MSQATIECSQCGWRHIVPCGRDECPYVPKADAVRVSPERPQDTYRWGETMPQFAVLGIGPEAWADLIEAERHAHQYRTTDRSHVSVRWGTFRLVMTVLRAIRLEDFRAVAKAGEAQGAEAIPTSSDAETKI